VGCNLRKNVLLIAGALVNLAVGIALAKGWADKIPDSIVFALFALSLASIIYWIVTHEKLLTHRENLRQLFRHSPWSTSIVGLVLASAIIVSCAIGGEWLYRRTRYFVKPSPTTVATTRPVATIQSATTEKISMPSYREGDTATVSSRREKPRHKPGPALKSSTSDEMPVSSLTERAAYRSSNLYEGNQVEGQTTTMPPNSTVFRNSFRPGDYKGANQLNIENRVQFIDNAVEGMDVNARDDSFLYKNVFVGSRSLSSLLNDQVELHEALDRIHANLQESWKTLPTEQQQEKGELWNAFCSNISRMNEQQIKDSLSSLWGLAPVK
jgi:hypothetical protein